MAVTDGVEARQRGAVHERGARAGHDPRGVWWSTGAHAVSWGSFNLLYAFEGGAPSNLAGSVAGTAVVASGILSWMLLSQWMGAIATIRRSQGFVMPSDAWIWLAWLIPIAQLFSPARTIRRLGRDRVGMGLILTWWLPWLVATELVATRDQAQDPTGTALLMSAAILVSWICLATIIRRIGNVSVT